MSDNERTILEFPPSSPGVTPSRLPFFVVGLGASAGGIEALLRFFEQMPADNGMAFVVVLHLSPDHESNIAQILQAKTAMPVLQVLETVAIEKNHVYVIPPAKDLLMNDGVLQVVSAARPRGGHVGIDVFLRTLAEVHRERAVGVILSGSGSDGSVGLARIKERGGLAVAQTPDDAEYDSMPRTAIDSGMVDIVLPVVEIPQKLMEWSRNSEGIKLPLAEHVEDMHPSATREANTHDEGEVALQEIMSLLHDRTGNDFSHYKRASVLRRLERRLQVNAIPNIVAYRNYLAEHGEETRPLLQDLLISVTNFFRDRDAFEALERDIIPKIFAKAGETEQIRAWSAGCATGEEAYSLAMLLTDQNALDSGRRTIQVFGSDIDEAAISVARRGLYPNPIITDVSPAHLRQYFEQEEKHVCVRKDIRERVLFARHNLLRDPPFSRLHLVSCRNLLIYLNRDMQSEVFEMLHYALQPGGYLFLGSAESADSAPKLFVPINKKHRIYQAVHVKPGLYHSRAPLVAPSAEFSKLSAGLPHVSEPRAPTTEKAHRAFIDEYSLPSVLIDRDGNLLHATSHAGRFLRLPAGEASINIRAIIQPALQSALQIALFQAAQTHQPAETRLIPLSLDDKETAVRIVVIPGQNQDAAAGMTLLTFQEIQRQGNMTLDLSDSEQLPDAHDVHEQLQHATEQLRAVTEQYETALQDLKSSNEEFQAANEELRSTTEELEASKEELQSINEELLTSNLEWKRRIDEMAKDSDDLHNFISATDIAMIFVDCGIKIMRFTAPCNRLFNLISTDLGRSLLDITHQLDYPQLRQDIEHVLNTAELVEREVRSNDGRWHIARLLPYRNAERKVDGAVLTVIDISRRKAAEDRVREGEERLRLVAAGTKDYAIWTLDSDGLITSWNKGAAHLFGYAEEEMIGQSAEILFMPEDRAKNVFQDELRRARENGHIESQRWYLSKEGSRVLCSSILSPLLDATVRSYAIIAHTVATPSGKDLKKSSKLAWEKQERIRAEEAARVRDEFFAVLSHELKQPLNLIQLTAEMLARAPGTEHLPGVARGAATIKRMVTGQAKIIDDLMDLSRLHTGKLTLERTQVNFSDAISNVVSLMLPDARQKHVALNLEQEAPDLIVQGDLVRIEQITGNLLNNALKFTPAGGIVNVRIFVKDEVACMEIADTGKGIAPEALPFIFDMFRQADTGTTRQHGGMGIGLALVKELVDSHGGSVEVESKGLGQGTLFRVCLPTCISHQPIAQAGMKRSASLAGKRILLVDDDEEMLESLGSLLRLEGAQVEMASSGEAALSIAERETQPFNLIISDIGMPVMDGYALLEKLRNKPPTATTPAIALSGFTRPIDVEHALAAGFETHVRKPVAFDHFIEIACRLS